MAQSKVRDLTVIIPAKNESASVSSLVTELVALEVVAEVIVVDDGSTDATGELAAREGARVVRHDKSRGNGAAIKSGARASETDWLVFMDADGQHRPQDIPLLVDCAEKGHHDMVVGSRNRQGQASLARHAANGFYNWFASLVTGDEILDLTSGFRLVRRDCFVEFLHLLPNHFSYPTTITMSLLRAGYSVAFEPVTVLQRDGKSHIKPLKDGLRFLIIIFKIATLYAPLKVFVPIAVLHFVLGLARYAWTYATMGTFTNMSALLMVTGVQIFLIGLVSEQISTLMYKDSGKQR